MPNNVIYFVDKSHWVRQDAPYLCGVFKKILCLLVLMGILAQTSLRFGWTVYYYARKSTFVEQCINRDKPQLHCDGKCVLMQRLKSEDEQRNPMMPDMLRNIGDEVLFFEPISDFHLNRLAYCSERSQSARYEETRPEAPAPGIFKPPV